MSDHKNAAPNPQAKEAAGTPAEEKPKAPEQPAGK
jgi:hypothetical protein